MHCARAAGDAGPALSDPACNLQCKVHLNSYFIAVLQTVTPVKLLRPAMQPFTDAECADADMTDISDIDAEESTLPQYKAQEGSAWRELQQRMQHNDGLLSGVQQALADARAMSLPHDRASNVLSTRVSKMRSEVAYTSRQGEGATTTVGASVHHACQSDRSPDLYEMACASESGAAAKAAALPSEECSAATVASEAAEIAACWRTATAEQPTSHVHRRPSDARDSVHLVTQEHGQPDSPAQSCSGNGSAARSTALSAAHSSADDASAVEACRVVESAAEQERAAAVAAAQRQRAERALEWRRQLQESDARWQAFAECDAATLCSLTRAPQLQLVAGASLATWCTVGSCNVRPVRFHWAADDYWTASCRCMT